MSGVIAAKPSTRIPIKYNDNDLKGQEIDSSTTANTDAINPAGAKRVGVFIAVDTEDSSSATLDPKLQFSPDKGTTWVALPATANTSTQAAIPQFTATGVKFEWYDLCVDGEFTRLRIQLVQAGLTASEGLTYGEAFWILADQDGCD